MWLEQSERFLNRVMVLFPAGALGVDDIALNEAIKLDPSGKRIKIIIPSALTTLKKYMLRRTKEKVISPAQAKKLLGQLKRLKQINPKALIENNKKTINKTAYYQRIDQIIKRADKLIAFQVNQSAGVQYTIDRARKKKYTSKSISILPAEKYIFGPATYFNF